MTLDQNWFTEVCRDYGTAFSLEIRAKLADEQTPYQRIEIYATETFGNLMVLDGMVMLTGRDNFIYHEMMSHPALFTHPRPRRVAIIGGGDCGTLREVLRHGEVESVTQVEIDERVTRLAEQYFPELCTGNADPRARFYFGDGIEWMRAVEPGSLDVIIVDSTDPIGPAAGLFNEAFFRSCHRALGAQGILVQQSESPLLHMHILNAMYRAIASAGFAGIHTLMFPQPVYPSGWWSATMALKGVSLAEMRSAAAAAKPFATQYYSLDVHRAALVLPEFVRAELEPLTPKG